MVLKPKSEKVEIVYEGTIAGNEIYILYSRDRKYGSEVVKEQLDVNWTCPEKDIDRWFKLRASSNGQLTGGNLNKFVHELDSKVLEALLAELPDEIRQRIVS